MKRGRNQKKLSKGRRWSREILRRKQSRSRLKMNETKSLIK